MTTARIRTPTVPYIHSRYSLRKFLILSEKDPLDRRKVLVSLSPEGTRLCGEIHEGSVKTLRALVDHFGYERFSTFLDTASEIRDWLTQACPMAKDVPAQDPDTPEGGEHDC